MFMMATTEDHFPIESHLARAHARACVCACARVCVCARARARACVCVCVRVCARARVLSVRTFLPPVICFHCFFQSVLLEVFTAAAKLSNSKYLQQGGCFLHYVYCFCSNLKQVEHSAYLLSRYICTWQL